MKKLSVSIFASSASLFSTKTPTPPPFIVFLSLWKNWYPGKRPLISESEYPWFLDSLRCVSVIAMMLGLFASFEMFSICNFKLRCLDKRLAMLRDSTLILTYLLTDTGSAKKVRFFLKRDRTLWFFVLYKDTYKVSKSSRSDF